MGLCSRDIDEHDDLEGSKSFLAAIVERGGGLYSGVGGLYSEGLIYGGAYFRNVTVL